MSEQCLLIGIDGVKFLSLLPLSYHKGEAQSSIPAALVINVECSHKIHNPSTQTVLAQLDSDPGRFGCI